MRYFFLFVVLLFLSSCGLVNSGSGAIRLVKAEGKETLVIDKIINSDSKNKAPLQVNLSNGTAEEVDEIVVANERSIDIQKKSPSVNNESIPLKIEEVEPEVEDDAVVAGKALLAEKQANTSFYFLIAGLISIFMPYLGFIPFVIGLILYSKADNSRYITPFGDDRLRLARAFIIADSIILTIWLLFLVLILLLFL